MTKPIIPVRALLAAGLKSRASYESIEASGVLADLNDTPGDLWHEIKTYYEGDTDAQAAHPELVQAALEGRYTNPKHRTRARDFIQGIAAECVSTAAVAEYVAAYRREQAGERLAASLLSRRNPDEQGRLLEAYLAAVSPADDAAVDTESSYLDAIRARVPKEGRIRVRLKSLNDRFRGGVLPGHSIVVAGRPNVAKTALVISLATGFARDGRKVLYIGNEDHISDLMVRAVSNVTGMTPDEIEKDPEGAINAALLEGLGNLIFRQLSPGTIPEIEKAVRQVKPEILIVDQLRNVSGKSTESYTAKLDEVQRGIRNIGIKCGVVTISVTQAGDSAEGKVTLTMSDLDNSKTGIPGACDVLLMIGANEQMKAAGLRRLTLAKNKISGLEDGFDVKINTTISKVTSGT